MTDSNLPKYTDYLPEGFQRPKPFDFTQRCLFTKSLRAHLVDLKISVDDFARWRDSNWLNFEVALTDMLDVVGHPTIQELIFVRDLVRSGLSDAQIQACLDELPTPYAYDPAELYFSLRYGWLQRIPTPSKEEMVDAYMEDSFEQWLTDLRDAEDLETLRRIGDSVQHHIDMLTLHNSVYEDDDTP